MKKTSSKIAYLLIVFNLLMFMLIHSQLKNAFPNLNIMYGKAMLISRLLLFITITIFYILSKVKIKRILLLVMLSILTIVSYLFSHSWNLFDVIVAPIILSDLVNYNRVIKVNLIVLIFFIFIIAFLYFNGVLNINTFINVRTGNENRLHFGFIHPNYFACFLMIISFLLSLNMFNNKFLHYLLISVSILIFIFVFPNSLSPFFTLLFYNLLLIIYKFIIKDKNIVPFLFIIIFFIFIAIIALFYFSYNIYILRLDLVDNIKTAFQRLKDGNIVLMNSSISWFGNKDLRFYFEGTLNLDCLYFKIIYEYGLVFTLSFIVFYIILMYKNISNKNYVLLMILLSMLLFSFMESTILQYCFMCFYICSIKSNK